MNGLLLLLLALRGGAAYVLPSAPLLQRRSDTAAACRASTASCSAKSKRSATAGRGFGAPSPQEPRSSKPTSSPPGVKAVPPSAQPTTLPSAAIDDSRTASEARGRAALDRLRQEGGSSASPPTERKMVLTPEELEPVSPDAGVMPQAVSDRMLRRVVPFAGLPVAGSVVLFGGFWFANTQLGYDLPPSIVAYSTQALLLLSFAGITYGVMSTSWDEGDEGSLLGFTEAARNTKMALGDAKAAQAEAKAGYMEADAAAEGVYMSKAALEKAKGKKRDERE